MVVDAHVAVYVSVVALVAALVVSEVVDVEEARVVEVDGMVPLDVCAAELLELVVELARLAELEDVEVGVVVPPGDGAEAK